MASELLAVRLNFMGGVGRPTSEECSAVLFCRSESPSQVFLIVISWLFEILQINLLTERIHGCWMHYTILLSCGG